MGHWHDVSAQLAEPGRSLKKMIPEVYDGFDAMNRAARDHARVVHMKRLLHLRRSLQRLDDRVEIAEYGIARRADDTAAVTFDAQLHPLVELDNARGRALLITLHHLGEADDVGRGWRRGGVDALGGHSRT